MNTKPNECWASESNPRTLRIDLSGEQSLLLPLNHFLFAEILIKKDEQEIRALFLTHEVLLRGTGLRRIQSALQRLELSYLCCMPSYFEKIIPEGQPVIRSIQVKMAHPEQNAVD